MRIRLPLSNGTTEYQLNPTGPLQAPAGPPPKSRIAYAAAHVVADPDSLTHAGDGRLDLEATLSFRRHLWSLGFGWPKPWTPPSAVWGYPGRQRRN